MTNDGTEPSPTVMLRMYIERNGGEAMQVKTFLASNTPYHGQSEDFGIPFTSDEVNAYHPDAIGRVVTDHSHIKYRYTLLKHRVDWRDN